MAKNRARLVRHWSAESPGLRRDRTVIAQARRASCLLVKMPDGSVKVEGEWLPPWVKARRDA